MSFSSITQYLPSLPSFLQRSTPPVDIFDACKKGDLEALKTFHKNGADLNEESFSGFLPLHYACRRGHLSAVKYLVEHGSNVNRLTNSSPLYLSPLYLACYNSHYAVAKYLLENGAQPNQYIKNGTATVLHYGEKITANIAQLLIKNGALLGAKDSFGRIPLHNVKSYAMANALKNAGSQTSARDCEGRTPLQVALSTNKYYVACCLNEKDKPWHAVAVQERDSKGQLSENEDFYLYDSETTDLYYLEPSGLKFRAKSFVVVAGALPFAIIATLTNLIKIVSDIALGIWKSIKDFSVEELTTSLKGLAVSILWDAPAAVITRIYRAACSPLFAIAMIFVGIYGLIDPIEGRKALNTIEKKWDESGLLDLAKMKRVGNLAESEINGYARYYLTVWDPELENS